ncbi:MAG: hypothetical protein ACP5HG_05215 [Anaerolineae bacterium]
MDINALVAVCTAMLDDPTLRQPENLAERIDALDYIDFALEVLTAEAQRYGAEEGYKELQHALTALTDELEVIDRAIFDGMRQQIRAGTLRGQALRERLNAYTTYRAGDREHRHLGFDTLDSAISGLLLPDDMPDPTADLTSEMVSYQATPGSVILERVDRVDLRPDMQFYDIGTGLGKVPMLVHLLTGVPSVGVEIDAALCAYARSQARNLGLDIQKTMRFVNADAREVSYGEGDVFYLFTPFTGTVLHAVMAKLEEQAQQSPIAVCTYGPCTPIVAETPWLHNADGNAEDPFKLAVFRSSGASLTRRNATGPPSPPRVSAR